MTLGSGPFASTPFAANSVVIGDIPTSNGITLSGAATHSIILGPVSSTGTPFNFIRGISASVRIGTPFNFIRGIPTNTKIGTPFNFIRGVTVSTRIGTPYSYDQLLRIKIRPLIRVKDLNVDEPMPLDVYVVATLPNPVYVGHIIYVTDEAGGPVLAFSDGTDWRRVTDRAIIT